MNRRNIVQFKPEGIANIFAPTIRLNGEFLAPENVPTASNDYHMDISHVSYPQIATVSNERERISQQNARNNNFDSLFMGLFNNLLSENENIPTSNRGENLFGVNGNGPASSDDYASFISSSLRDHYNCMNSNGQCVSKDDCPEGNRIGNCLLEDNVCCKSSSSVSRPTQVFGDLNQSSDVSSNFSTASAASNSPSGTSTSSLSGTQSILGTGRASAYGLGTSSSTESALRASASVCDIKCGRELKYEEDFYDEDGNIVKTEYLDTPKYIWRPCAPECRDSNCPNCPGPNYKNPNDLNGDGVMDEIVLTSQMDPEVKKRILEGRKSITIKNRNPSKISEKDACYGLNQTSCDNNSNCFYCLSDYKENNMTCYRNNNDQYICDQKNIGECVPIYQKSDGSLGADTAGPFHGSAEYNFYDKDIKNLGKKKTIEYPYQCKPPIKRVITYEDKRASIDETERYSDELKALLKRQRETGSMFSY